MCYGFVNGASMNLVSRGKVFEEVSAMFCLWVFSEASMWVLGA